MFFNVPGNPVGDIGYLESFTGAMTSTWRIGATWMWKFKLFQHKDPLRHPCYIYWLPGIEGPYQNYLLGTGLLPAYNSRAFTARDIPFISARYEVRQLSLAEADVSPNWRNDAITELECFTERQGNSGFVFMQQHGKDKVERVSVSTIGLGCEDRSRPLYMWLFRFRDGKSFNGTFGERDIATQYAKNRWCAERAIQSDFLGLVPWTERASREFKLKHGEGAMWMITQTPASILSINGQPTHFRLTSTPGISVFGDHKSLIVDTEFSRVEIGVILPFGVTAKTAKLNGKEVPYRIEMDNNCRMVVVDIPNSGKNQIEVEHIQVDSLFPISEPEIIVAGNKLILRSSAPLTFGIFKDAARVWSDTGNSFELELRGAVENGDYELRTMGLDGTPGAPIAFKLADAAVPTRVDRLLDHLEVIEQVDRRNIESPSGIVVSEARAAWSDGAGDPDGTFADAEKMIVQCATLPKQRSAWNFVGAGFEIQTKRYLKVELLNGMTGIRCLNPGYHSVKYDDPQSLIGLVLDFADPDGYKMRTVAGFGLQNEKRSVANPCWGRNAKPDRIMQINNIVRDNELERQVIWLDLVKYGAPHKWNGKIYFNMVFGNIAPSRKFGVRIIETAETIPTGEIEAIPTLMTTLIENETRNVNRVNGKPDWNTIPTWQMHSTIPGQKVELPTQFKVAYDQVNFYLHYEMNVLLNQALTPGDKVWNGDGIEFMLQHPMKPERMLHYVVGCNQEYLAYDSALIQNPGSKEIQLYTNPVSIESRINGDKWMLTLTLPWSFFGQSEDVKGRSLAFNAMRNMRNAKSGRQENFLLAPGNKYFSGDSLKLLFQ